MSYTKFQVGEKFPLPIKAQGDGGIFQYDINGAMFILKLSQTDLVAVEAFRTGIIDIALFAADDILFFLYKIDGIFKDWGDCPYHIQTISPQLRPNFTKESEKILNLYLIDSRLDILLSMRTANLSEDFYKHLVKAAEKQSHSSLTDAEYAAKVQAIWQQYTPDQMYQHALAKQNLPLEIHAPNPYLQ